MKRRNYIYIASPYMGSATHYDIRSYDIIDTNIVKAKYAMAQLATLGYGVFCPHTHGAHLEIVAPKATAAYWLEIDLHFLRTSCDALLRLPGYSKGSDGEVEVAKGLGLPIYYDIDTLSKELPVFSEEWEWHSLLD